MRFEGKETNPPKVIRTHPGGSPGREIPIYYVFIAPKIICKGLKMKENTLEQYTMFCSKKWSEKTILGKTIVL